MLAKIVDFPVKSSSKNDAQSLAEILNFLNRVSSIPDSVSNFSAATKEIFAEVCRYTNWPIGHLYVRTDDGLNYISKNIWYVDESLERTAIAEFRSISEETVFELGKGLIGNIAQEQKAKAVEDVTTLKTFLRADAAKRSGVRGGFGFPIIVNGSCVAVAEFYGREAGLLDQTSLEIMTYVSAQLARLYEREENNQLQHKLVQQFESSVQTSIQELVTSSEELNIAGSGVQAKAESSNLQCVKVVEGRNSILTNMNTLQQAMQQLIQVENETVSSNNQVNETVCDLSANITDALNELRDLGKLTSQIETIARNVSEISAQVRMLGLNASIEAARAGEAGKGFSIVASEIKSLAQQSEKSSQDISEQLGGILKISTSGIHLMEAVDGSMAGLEETTNKLSFVVENQHNATETIKKSLDCAQKTLDEIDQDIESMSIASKDLLNLSENVGTNAHSLKQLSSNIENSSQSFISEIQS